MQPINYERICPIRYHFFISISCVDLTFCIVQVPTKLGRLLGLICVAYIDAFIPILCLFRDLDQISNTKK